MWHAEKRPAGGFCTHGSMEATHLIRLHDPSAELANWRPCVVKGKSWARFQDEGEAALRFARMEITQRSTARATRHQCKVCNLEFGTAKGLKHHMANPGLTHALHTKSKHQRTAMQYNRSARRTKQLIDAEITGGGAVVRTIDNHILPTCSKFKYLGTTISPRRGMAPEIRKRATTAIVVIGTLKKVFRNKALQAKLKRELFQALVLSIFLYNAETWSLNGIQKNWAGGIYRQLIIMAFGRRSWIVGGKKIWESNSELLTRTGLNNFDYVLAYKKAMFVSHIIRGDEPLTKESLHIGKKHENRKFPISWWTRYNKELAGINMTHEKIVEHSHQPATLKKLIKDSNTGAV